MLYSHDGPEEDRSLTQDLENNNNNKTNKQTKTNNKKKNSNTSKLNSKIGERFIFWVALFPHQNVLFSILMVQ